MGRRFPVASFTEEDDSGVEMVVDESGDDKGKQKSTKLLSKRSHENIDDEEPDEGSTNRKTKRRLFCKS
ncbi:hypothetical protein SERLADRAFT_381493 [Serpula lacrymans var. lacrymans S7.9]|uniref:Uncharacterized protein n=1 Tax=Serpula lacrymans var. lacrymans (strain S7.9) TaxID=578457 RepID=F8NPG6_SERL9|nr:uncharacterized protein SERLADRAFT_381493 [Serpula lacrymans var. lacrymans S7.9]EGO27176.1 hypothetical protein SERLADRAFT_381493 [Serpula lacrymans var. lacrymans S7.9]